VIPSGLTSFCQAHFNHLGVSGHIAIAWLIVSGCANQVAPTGGPKDVQAPKVITESPASGSLNFSGPKIILEFDERVQILTGKGQLTLSPPHTEKLRTSVKGKKLEIILPDSLYEQTTYSIDFGQAVGDLNEGNVFKDYVYAFSTGDILDSMTISGEVAGAMDAEPQKDVVVMLYPDTENDTLILKEQPRYIGRTDDNGKFILRFLREGRYHLVALKDDNFDLKYTSGEAVAFVDSLIVVDTLERYSTLRLFTEAPPLRLSSLSLAPSGQVIAAPNRPSATAEIDIRSGTLVCASVVSSRDTISAWLLETSQDTIKAFLYEEGLLTDSMTAFRRTFEREFQVKPQAPMDKPATGQTLVLHGSLPCSQQIDSVYVMNDSLALGHRAAVIGDTCGRRFIIAHDWALETNYTVDIPFGAFISIYADTSPATTFGFSYVEAAGAGKLAVVVDLTMDSIPVIVQIIGGRPARVLIEREAAAGSLNRLIFDDLTPWRYRIVAIVDANRNGLWDTGNFTERLQPERVVTYPQTIEAKPGWEQEITIELKSTTREPNHR